MIENVMQFGSLSTAFQQVKENQGCAGVDGVTIEAFEQELHKNLYEFENELSNKKYSHYRKPSYNIWYFKGNKGKP